MGPGSYRFGGFLAHVGLGLDAVVIAVALLVIPGSGRSSRNRR